MAGAKKTSAVGTVRGEEFADEGIESPAVQVVQATDDDLGKAAQTSPDATVPFDETLPGGAFIVGGVWMDASGRPLSQKAVDAVRALNAAKAATMGKAEMERQNAPTVPVIVSQVTK